MITTLKKLLGLGESPNIETLVANGAMILDVRTKGEYQSGHVKGSVNIPLDQLSSSMGKLKDKERAIITCCASGMRSGSAKSFLRSQGYKTVHNGGSWRNLQKFGK